MIMKQRYSSSSSCIVVAMIIMTILISTMRTIYSSYIATTTPKRIKNLANSIFHHDCFCFYHRCRGDNINNMFSKQHFIMKQKYPYHYCNDYIHEHSASVKLNHRLLSSFVSNDNNENNNVNRYHDKNNQNNNYRNNGWKIMNWDKVNRNQEEDEMDESTSLSSSPIDVVSINQHKIYIKRDDLLVVPTGNISGNKARKMYSLTQLSHNDFPLCIVSYGGTQSNAMVALASIVSYYNNNYHRDNNNNNNNNNNSNQQRPRYCFVYYTKQLSLSLKQNPNGNLKQALLYGMELIELSSTTYKEYFDNNTDDDDILIRTSYNPFIIPPPIYNNTLYIPQGGALYQMAIVGSNQLANEIYNDWYNIHSEKTIIIPPLTVLIPGGTCTTALLVHHSIQDRIRKENKKLDNVKQVLDIKIVVIPCVGDDIYARQQMIQLNHQIISLYQQQYRHHHDRNHPIDLEHIQMNDIPYILSSHPTIIQSTPKNSKPDNNKYFPFGKPNQLILQTYNQLYNETNITFDLIYGSPSWTILLRHLNHSKHHDVDDDRKNDEEQAIISSASQLLYNRELMYVHSGGLEGIPSQLLRYKYNNINI